MIKCGRLAAPVKIGGGGCVGLTVAGIGVIYSFGVVVGGMGVKVGMGVSEGLYCIMFHLWSVICFTGYIFASPP